MRCFDFARSKRTPDSRVGEPKMAVGSHKLFYPKLTFKTKRVGKLEALMSASSGKRQRAIDTSVVSNRSSNSSLTDGTFTIEVEFVGLKKEEKSCLLFETQ